MSVRTIPPASQKFRDDIDLDNTWVVSDTHFGHDNIVGYCHRPEDHDQVIVAEWRKAIGPDATVLHLGDLSYKGNAWFKNIISKELTGARKLLIMGNHDRSPQKFYRDCGFKPCRPFSITVRAARNDKHVVVEDFDPEKWVESHGPGARGWGAENYRRISFSHYPWSDNEEGGPITDRDLRIHGHIHNNGYTRTGFVPFLRNHINLSVEQTGYRPVNLRLLLDAALLGRYDETTDEQLAEVRARKEARKS